MGLGLTENLHRQADVVKIMGSRYTKVNDEKDDLRRNSCVESNVAFSV